MGLLGRLGDLFGRRADAKSEGGPDFRAAQDVAFLPAADFRFEVCPLCGDRPTGHLSVYPALPGGRMRGRVVWWCDACGGGFVPNARGLIEDYYETNYAAEIKQDRALSPEEYFASSADEAAVKRHLRRVKHQVAKLRKRRRTYNVALDFGAGPGYFLKHLTPKTKLAVELDPSCAKFLDYVGATTVALSEVKPASCDLVMASHALEHLLIEDLDGTLAAFRSALKPGGLLYIEVPQAALTTLELPYHHEPHTIFFSPRGLERPVLRAGFEIVERSYRGRKPLTFRANAIWSPDESDPFEASIRGSMTIIARRPRKPRAK